VEAPASALSKVCSCCARQSQYVLGGYAKNGGLDAWLGATGNGNRQGGVNAAHAGFWLKVRTCASSAMVMNESKSDGGGRSWWYAVGRRDVAGVCRWPFKRRLRVLDFEKGPARGGKKALEILA
jgi:hypothetical protein